MTWLRIVRNPTVQDTKLTREEFKECMEDLISMVGSMKQKMNVNWK